MRKHDKQISVNAVVNCARR